MIQNLDFITDFIFVEDNITPCDIILVPGGSHSQLAEKVADLYNQGMAKYILFSGRANPNIPETDKRGLNRDNWTTKEEYIDKVMSEVEKIGKYFKDKLL